LVLIKSVLIVTVDGEPLAVMPKIPKGSLEDLISDPQPLHRAISPVWRTGRDSDLGL